MCAVPFSFDGFALCSVGLLFSSGQRVCVCVCMLDRYVSFIFDVIKIIYTQNSDSAKIVFQFNTFSFDDSSKLHKNVIFELISAYSQ